MMTWKSALAGILLGAFAVPAIADEGEADRAAIQRTNESIRFANYPSDSLQRGEEGVVGILVTTDRKGRLMNCDVTKSSGYRALDTASCEFLLRYGKSKPYLAADGRSITRAQEGQVVWKLPDAYVKAEKPAFTTQAGRVPDKKICHVQSTTGSFAKTQRICMTRSEWARQTNEAQDDLRSMVPKYQPGQ